MDNNSDVVLRIDREWAMPSGSTFTIPPIKHLLEEELALAVDILDPFAGFHSMGTMTNDLNPEAPTTEHKDALDFLIGISPESMDAVLLDPPYSITQATQLYGGRGKNLLGVHPSNMAYWARVKDYLRRAMRPGAKAICCGWSSMGLGKSRGLEMRRILLVPHGGSKNDTIVTVEIMKAAKV